MSRTHQRSLTHSSQGSLSASSRFKEHLTVAVPPPDPDPSREHSRFSPDSPTERAFSLGKPTFSHTPFPRLRPLDLEKGSSGDSSSTSQQGALPSFRDRFARLFADLRAVGPSRVGNGPFVQRAVPIVAPSFELPTWRPLDIRKHGAGTTHCDHCHVQPPAQTRRQKWYHRALASALAVFLLYLFINVVILNVRLYSLSHWPPRTSSISNISPASPPTNTVMLSADAQQCITQYTLDAPGNPTGYPCSTCVLLLAAIPPNATEVYPVALAATQFCGLRSIWEDAGQQGQAGLEAGGWVKDVKFCTWNGVRCDGAGRVSSL
jgi:hypothetical protein